MPDEKPIGIEESPGPLDPEEPSAAPPPNFKTVLLGLGVLQKKDEVIAQLRKKLEDIPKTIEEIHNTIQEDAGKLAAAKEEGKALLVERKSLEMDLAKREEEIRKRSGELQQVKSNDAYKALMTEIGSSKAEKDKIEDKILQIFDRLDQDKKQQGEGEKAFQQTKKDLQAQAESLEKEKGTLDQALKQEEESRVHLAQGIPTDVLEHYERLRSKKGGVATVPVVHGNSCGGCRLNVSQQVINNILKGKDFVICERCQRILYLPA